MTIFYRLIFWNLFTFLFTSLEMVKNHINLEGATKQNVLIFRKYASKNSPMPPMCKIGPVQQRN